MPYEDFKGVPWKVIAAGEASACVTGDGIVIDGPPEWVTIQCQGKSPYDAGAYIPASNTIEGLGYKITLVDTQPRQIQFDLLGSIGGSWTAEDTSGGVGDGGVG